MGRLQKTFRTAVSPLDVSWYAQPNDLIGGWCITTTDMPLSAGAFEVADMFTEEVARHIVRLHNDWLHQPGGSGG